MSNSLLENFAKNGLNLKNRVVMAPMTRSRSTADHVPTDIMATYYHQRTDAGLIITEGTSPSINGAGYPRIPGVYNAAQTEAWKQVATAVHKTDTKIFMQLMHTGRVTHPDNLEEGGKIIAPSPVQAETTKMYVDGKGELEIPEPNEMTAEEIQAAIQEYVTASENAIAAGFDGVELHAANGYLMEQFINTGTNKRDDEYGGSVENRCRFVLEAASAVLKAVGKQKVGIRLSPNGAFNDIEAFDGQKETFDYLTKKLNELELVYIHLVNHESMGANPLPDDIRKNIRDNFDGILILSGGYNQESAQKDIDDNKGDIVAFGRPFIANPDLVTRWENGAELNNPNQDTFYTPGKEGYIDYPALD